MDITGLKSTEINNVNELLNTVREFSKFSLWNKKAIVIDLDGTVYKGEKPIPGSISFINKNCNSFSFYFITNNTSRNKKDYFNKLKKMGISEVFEHQIITPTSSICSYLREQAKTNIYCVGTENFKRELSQLELNCLDDDDYLKAEALILSYDTEITYTKIANAALLLQNSDILYVASHIDLVCPTEKGSIPDIGSYISLFETATKRRPDIIFGKPDPNLLTDVLKNYKKEEIVIIGDRLYTDKILADKSNIDFVLVLSGESNREDVEKETYSPALIINELREIEE